MDFSVCVYPETAEALLKGTTPEVLLELQSFGLKGVRSSTAWNERAEFYASFARAHRERRFHLHGPFLDLPWWSYDHLIEEVVRRRVADTVALCGEIRPEHLVMHLSCPGYFCLASRVSLWVEHALEFWRPWLERLRESGTLVVFENTSEPDPVAAKAFAEASESLGAAICLDIGHAHTFSPTPPVEWVRSLGTRITHYHIHDNDGSDDWHRAPGEGNIDFSALMPEIARLTPNASLSMEVETGAAETLKALEFSRASMKGC
ncbi:MAG: sugar phosphate isomerase/epimerase family protein [Spirochaetales bacterium]